MSDETSLERAHALSAHASILLGPGQVTAQTLKAALKAYNDAADLFEQASQGADGGASAKRTLQLLTTQHRKLARDLERKLQSAPIQNRGEGSSITRPLPPRQEGAQRGSVKRSQTTPVPVRDGPPLGLGAIGREAWPPPGIATRVSPARGLPPFAMRPASSTRPEGLHPSHPTEQALSPLHSSSSSSGTEAGGSYINFGAIPDTLDPFSRFWGKLDNMLDDISNPVAFATASLDAGQAAGEDDVKEERRERRRTSDRKKEKEQVRGSPGSFYLVNKHNLPKETSNGSSSRTASPTEKTPEELVLENENLRISLDAIASRAQEVDDENKRLKAEAGERSKMMKSAILEVKREYDELKIWAQKAKHGTDLMRSQLLGSIPSPNPRMGSRLEVGRYPGGAPAPNSDLVISQKKRIESLEEELRLMKLENEKNKEAAAKYKERIDKIKANAKIKKEAKSKGEGLSRE